MTDKDASQDGLDREDLASSQPSVDTNSLPLDQVICGDNCDVMRAMPCESIDLVVTSPPYDGMRKYGGCEWDFYGVAWNLKRLLKPGGVIVWNVADQTIDGSETCASMRQVLHFRRLGLLLHDSMIWDKPNCMPGNGKHRYHNAFEYCFVFSKGRPAKTNILRDRKNSSAGRVHEGVGGRTKDGKKRNEVGYKWVTPKNGYRTNVWRLPTVSAERVDHPAPFPSSLVEGHVLSWSDAGDVVLDPFGGSGTTAMVAKSLGRRFVIVEVNQEYCKVARERIGG